MRQTSDPYWRWLILWSSLAVVAVVVALALLVFQPGPSGVVASLRLPDGSQYMLTQRWNQSLEPYTVSFFSREPGGAWGWCYVDHKAGRWRVVKMTYDAAQDAILVTERGIPRCKFDRKARTFWIDNGSIKRTLSAPQQEVTEPEFPFPARPEQR